MAQSLCPLFTDSCFFSLPNISSLLSRENPVSSFLLIRPKSWLSCSVSSKPGMFATDCFVYRVTMALRVMGALEEKEQRDKKDFPEKVD